MSINEVKAHQLNYHKNKEGGTDFTIWFENPRTMVIYSLGNEENTLEFLHFLAKQYGYSLWKEFKPVPGPTMG